MLGLTLLMFSSCMQALQIRSFHKHPSIVSQRAVLFQSTWQEDLDKWLDIDTPWQSRRSLSRTIAGKFSSIYTDVTDAVRERNLNKIAPKSLQYGKAINGLRSFKSQLVSDIVPEIFTKVIPIVIEEGPKIISKVISDGPSSIVDRGQSFISNAREIAQDPSMIQSTLDDIRREVRNIVKSTPAGLETPPYNVVEVREQFEVRQYSAYTVCSTPLTSSESSGSSESGLTMSILPVSTGFTELADYVFGKNVNDDGESEKMKMTTPVIIDDQSMSFILSQQFTADTAPTPVADSIILKDIPAELVAAREFTGITTENEVSKQKAKLEDALISAGIVYDNSSFKVLNYNPPFTVPWIRRNEVSFRITLPEGYVPMSMTSTAEPAADPTPTVEIIESDIVAPVESIEGESTETSKFSSAPEAGD